MADKPETINRRGTLRRSPRGRPKVQCRRGRTGLGRNLAEKVTDVSRTGAQIVVRESFEPEAEVEVTVISVGEVKPAVLRGSIIRCVPQEGGLFVISIHFEKPMSYALWQKLT